MEKRKQELIDILDKVFSLGKIKYSDFNQKYLEEHNKELLKLEKQNDKLGVHSLGGISILTLIATITDILCDSRLSFKIDDDGYIVGAQWFDNPDKCPHELYDMILVAPMIGGFDSAIARCKCGFEITYKMLYDKGISTMHFEEAVFNAHKWEETKRNNPQLACEHDYYSISEQDPNINEPHTKIRCRKCGHQSIKYLIEYHAPYFDWLCNKEKQKNV